MIPHSYGFSKYFKGEIIRRIMVRFDHVHKRQVHPRNIYRIYIPMQYAYTECFALRIFHNCFLHVFLIVIVLLEYLDYSIMVS